MIPRFVLVALFVLASASAARAEAPRLSFDMPYAVACKDVTPPPFAAANPGYKLVEAKLQLSSLLVAGQERDLTQLFIKIENRERPLAVIDYVPKTLHESRLAGPVTISDSDEKNASLGINLSGKYELFAGAGFTAGLGQKKTSCVKYDLLPPLEAVAASGTLNRGSTLFFKLKATPRHLMEGTREFGLVLRVPANWRSDYARVSCQADGIRRGAISTFDEEVGCGKREFVVALYLEGDEQARLSAEAFARRQAAEAQSPPARSPGSGKTAAWNVNAPWEMLRR